MTGVSHRKNNYKTFNLLNTPWMPYNKYASGSPGRPDLEQEFRATKGGVTPESVELK
jgi:hypothetical protein